jgi:hypothetical protein
MIKQPFAPKRPTWFVGAAASITGALVIYFLWSASVPWRPGRAGGLTFGTLAALVFVFEGLYPVRRRLMAWPLGTAQRWLQLHIYAGVTAFVCVLAHIGFAWPTGSAGWWLLGLSLWTTASGLLGVALQKWIPSVVSDSLQVEALASRMPELTARLLAEADRVMSGASDRVSAVYQTEIRPSLQRPDPAWSYVANVQGGRARYARPLAALERSARDPDRVSELRAIVSEKAELDVHLSLQRALRGWLLLHVPAALLLLGLLAVHVFAALYL